MKHCSEPKFDIGQTVRHVAGDADRSLFIVTVITETCPGGTQHSYVCRAIIRGGVATDCFRLNEVELRLTTPEELEAETQHSVLQWIVMHKENAVADKDFEQARAWMTIQNSINELKEKEPQ